MGVDKRCSWRARAADPSRVNSIFRKQLDPIKIVYRENRLRVLDREVISGRLTNGILLILVVNHKLEEDFPPVWLYLRIYKNVALHCTSWKVRLNDFSNRESSFRTAESTNITCHAIESDSSPSSPSFYFISLSLSYELIGVNQSEKSSGEDIEEEFHVTQLMGSVPTGARSLWPISTFPTIQAGNNSVASAQAANLIKLIRNQPIISSPVNERMPQYELFIPHDSCSGRKRQNKTKHLRVILIYYDDYDFICFVLLRLFSVMWVETVNLSPMISIIGE